MTAIPEITRVRLEELGEEAVRALIAASPASPGQDPLQRPLVSICSDVSITIGNAVPWLQEKARERAAEQARRHEETMRWGIAAAFLSALTLLVAILALLVQIFGSHR